MKIATRFPIAVHVLLCIERFSGTEHTTSDFIAGSVGVNPVVIRQVLQKLKAASLVTVERGVGGAHLAKSASDITLLDVYRAMGSVEGSIFAFHDSPNPDCPIGGVIEDVLGHHLEDAQQAMEASLARVSLQGLLDEAERAHHGASC